MNYTICLIYFRCVVWPLTYRIQKLHKLHDLSNFKKGSQGKKHFRRSIGNFQIYVLSNYLGKVQISWEGQTFLRKTPIFLKVPSYLVTSKQTGRFFQNFVAFLKYLNIKVHIFWEGHKVLWNIHLTFVLCSASQK